MSVQTIEMKSAIPVATVLRLVRSPLRIPAWSALALIVLAGLYGFVMGREKPIHHYVPYVGYPLVMDTTTGKACYSSEPRPVQDTAAGDVSDSAGVAANAQVSNGPSIPMCGKE